MTNEIQIGQHFRAAERKESGAKGALPAELRKAHRDLDLAVDKLYRTRSFTSDRERVEHLFPLYEALVQPTSAAPKANRRTAKRVKAVTK